MLFSRTCFWGASLIAIWLATHATHADTPSQHPTRVSIDAVIDEKGAHLAGTVEISLRNNTGAPLNKIPLWLYPNRFRRTNPKLDDRMIRWIYPSGESEGGMAISAPVWNGTLLPDRTIELRPLPPRGRDPKVDDVIAWVFLPTPLEPGVAGTLRLDFSVEIPERRGRFGRHRGTVSLGGGWFPRPLADLTGQDITSPPDTIEANVRLALPAGRGAILHDQIFRWSDKARTIDQHSSRIEALVLIVMDMMEVTEQQFAWGKVVHVHRELRNRKATWKDTRGDGNGLPPGLPDIGKVDISARLFEIVDGTAAIVNELAPGQPLPDQLVLVEVPAWDRLAQPGPGPVIVSDRIWRIIPVEQGMWFHDLAVARAVGAEFVRPAVRTGESLDHRYVTADVVGSVIAETYSRNVHKASKSVAEMVGFASFVPTVDNLLYAPQVPFREVYSQSIEEPDLLRDEPWRFMNRLPRGKRVLGKLTDLLGRDETWQLLEESLARKQRLEVSLTQALGGDSSWFFDQWYGDYPLVNYRLGSVEDSDLGDGRIRHRVEIIREGEVTREPVTVRITDENDEHEDVTWSGDGRSGRVEWISNAPLDQVQIDPSGRLVEAPQLTANHPLGDNYHHLPWRPPMITRILFWGDVTSGDPYVQVGFSLRRRYDITNSVAFAGSYTPRSFGGKVAYYRYFGPKRTLNSRSWYVGPSLGMTRYLKVTDAGPEIPENTRFAATAGSVGLVLGRDDRSYFYDPRSGSGFWIATSYSAGQDEGGRAVQVGRLSSNVVGVASPAIRHTFALSLGATGLVGNPAAAQLGTLSVRQILRGFDVDETYGRVGIYAVAEYRHTLFDAAHVPVPVLSWFDRFQGVLFLGGGTITRPTGYTGLFAEDRLFSEVGYGLRIHTLAFGVQQYVVAFDLAYALTPVTRERQIEQADGTIAFQARNPLKLTFGIMQTF